MKYNSLNNLKRSFAKMFSRKPTGQLSSQSQPRHEQNMGEIVFHTEKVSVHEQNRRSSNRDGKCKKSERRSNSLPNNFSVKVPEDERSTGVNHSIYGTWPPQNSDTRPTVLAFVTAAYEAKRFDYYSNIKDDD